jgi:hypothetical protein
MGPEVGFHHTRSSGLFLDGLIEEPPIQRINGRNQRRWSLRRHILECLS